MNGMKKIAAALALAVAGGMAVPANAADGMNRWVYFVNGTDQTIWNVYARNVSGGPSTRDLLGAELLEPGDGMWVNVDDHSGHCRFNLTAVYESDYRGYDRNVNVCSVSEFRFRG